MIKFIKNFRKDEDGAVTVDWVVLTAAIVGLAAVAYTQIGNGTESIANAVGSTLSSASVATSINLLD
ncbi:Flp family type IVb pilin [Ruegeria sp. SCP11]|uniref:Flp family type IVb pilin n=1 Tax=Ruegeria sp. SCP11 TaxID=3141378 RepID=UPI0033388ECA